MNGTDVKTNRIMETNSNRTVLKQNCNDIDRILAEDFALTEETTCGLWIFKGAFLQK